MPTLHHSVFYRPDALPVNRFVFTINMQNVTLMHSCRWGRGWVWKSHGDRTDWDGGSGDGDGVQMGKRTTGMAGDGDRLLYPCSSLVHMQDATKTTFRTTWKKS